jgi:hypothetical protein
VLYLIWRDPWMTVARDTYISRLLARVAGAPAGGGGRRAAPRATRAGGRRAWLARVREVLLSSEPYRLRAATVAEAQALCPTRACAWSTASACRWYGRARPPAVALPARAGALAIARWIC